MSVLGSCYKARTNALEGLRIVLSHRSTAQLSGSITRRHTSSSPPSFTAWSAALHHRANSSSGTPPINGREIEHNPLKPRYPTDELGLPLEPLPLAVPHPAPGNLTSTDLDRLHRLSALNPPPAGSTEEKELLQGLNELVGLMDLVKAVELPREDIRQLLGEGVGEVTFDASTDPVETPPTHVAGPEESQVGEEGGMEGKEKQGRELLEWATRRKGDYYAYRSPPRPSS